MSEFITLTHSEKYSLNMDKILTFKEHGIDKMYPKRHGKLRTELCGADKSYFCNETPDEVMALIRKAREENKPFEQQHCPFCSKYFSTQTYEKEQGL